MKKATDKKFRSAREAALIALLSWLQDGIFLADSFQAIRKMKSLSAIDLQLAQEIAYGVVRRFETLNYLIKTHLKGQKIKLKAPSRCILKMAVYQLVFMDRVPLYAVVFESVELSKKFSPYQAGFINGILRKFALDLPLKTWATQAKEEEVYSLPAAFIQEISAAYPNEKMTILEASILRPKMTFLAFDSFEKKNEYIKVYDGIHFQYYNMKKDHEPFTIFDEKKVYIQNPTPGMLIETLSKEVKFKRGLDLCSAPGGKLILLDSIFKGATWTANEVSGQRAKTLKENLIKYDLNVNVVENDGTTLETAELFDFIVVDAPCSNSGVLNKKPEARYRLNEQTLDELKNLQLKLLENAYRLLEVNGQIWYMTCSILPEENEKILDQFVSNHPDMKIKTIKLILPDLKGVDGGFGAAITKENFSASSLSNF